ncbi:dUTP diphosphatase [Priestia megaterium]|uniref:dUTP diphosphatase n=1 Tax=Priestia megaterium TaxID=1404 RepID=A0AAX6BDL0_PRIMG|nr:dUTP diphosphatase [Priestia megaterium]QSF32510.1 dUTP diphosphatase [Priestia megaterium]GMG71798.1 dUTP diphosphatase [Priestia megaterium]
MNLTKLFDMQRVLDQRIMDKHPELKGQDNLEWKVLALQVELGECANEHRGFKKWSNDQEPRTAWKQPSYRGGYIERNLLLEEYVDCLHFILSIGIELGFTDIEIWGSPEKNTTKQFLKCFHQIDSLSFIMSNDWDVTIEVYENLFGTFVELGKTLGFTWEQIEQAYFEKNEINHIRQEQGY